MPAQLHIRQAQARAAVLSAVSYAIELDLRDAADSAEFSSRTTVRFTATPGAHTFLQLSPAELRSVRVNGAELDLSGHWDAASGRIHLPELRMDNTVNTVEVLATMRYSHDGEGLHKYRDPADGNTYLYATSALAAAPRWFACFDQPDIKASLTLNVRAPAGWSVLGNGAGTQLAPGRWAFTPTPPISSYLATVIAGPYHAVHSRHDGIGFGLHARASLAPELTRDAAELMSFTHACMDEYHRLFGIRYPWGDYHQVFCPEFNWGAMEQPGAVTLRDSMIFRGQATTAERASRAATIAHEMAHMWFGNLVTFRWWDELWLNESFAEYLGHRVTSAVSDYDSWTDFGAVRKAWGYAADRRPTTHPVAGNGVADVAEALNAFDGISYAKGAAVLKQLAAYLGEPVFLRGLRDYFAAHAYGNASFADLIAAWSKAAGGTVADGELARWAEAWLHTSGMDTLSIAGSGSSTVLHRAGARPQAITVSAFAADGRELAAVPVRAPSEHTAVEISPAVLRQTALLLPDARDESWAKTALPAAAWAALPGFAAALPTSARVNISNALRLALADAELDPLTAAATAAALLAGEADEALITSLGTWGTDVLADRYAASGQAHRAIRAHLAEAADTLLHRAQPGSGRQLAAARLLVAACDDLGLIETWLSGATPGGLELDADLCWRLLGRLVAAGAAGAARIDAQAAADPGSQGAEHAARLRALIPEPQAKAAAWDLLMHDDAASNYTLYATAAGFWHREHTALTAPYVARYFEQIGASAELRGDMVSKRLALSAYPATHIEPRTVELAEALLADGNLAPALDKTIGNPIRDATDDLRRALASHQRFS